MEPARQAIRVAPRGSATVAFEVVNRACLANGDEPDGAVPQAVLSAGGLRAAVPGVLLWPPEAGPRR